MHKRLSLRRKLGLRRSGRLTLAIALLVGATSVCHAKPHKHRSAPARRTGTHQVIHLIRSSRAASVRPARRSMDPARATEIQIALIKAGYLTGEPTGQWDANSEAAMQHLQADNGWQSKITPDSRALIKLGLGPQTADAGSMTDSSSDPAAPRTNSSLLSPGE